MDRSLSLEQLDRINLSLSKAMAIAQLMANCGSDRPSVPGGTATGGNVFVVMQVMLDELEKIAAVLNALGREEGEAT